MSHVRQSLYFRTFPISSWSRICCDTLLASFRTKRLGYQCGSSIVIIGMTRLWDCAKVFPMLANIKKKTHEIFEHISSQRDILR